MAAYRRVFRCLARALLACGGPALAGAVPFGDVLAAVVGDAWHRLAPHEWLDGLQGVAQLTAGAAQEVAAAIIDEVCADEPKEVRQRLATCLAAAPSLARRSSLLSVPALTGPGCLLGVLPARLPRFRSGDVPPGVGDWELVELLGAGGFGEVWQARHRFFDGIAPVALKFCLDPGARDRLLRHEAGVLNRVLRQSRHPGIVQLLDAHLGAEPPCLKYEYVAGGDLAAVIRAWAPLPVPERAHRATPILVALAEALATAHRLDPPIVHRDLKPANVLMGAGPRIADFGIGGVASLPGLQSTSRGELLESLLRGAHTPLYASPQQARGAAPDPRDDVHALGVLWHQMIVGDLGAGVPAGLWAEELREDGVPAEVIRLLGACVSARPEKRPADAGALAERLAALAPRPGEAPARTDGPRSWLLDLAHQGVGDEGVARLLAAPSSARLRTLQLNGNGLTDDAARAIAAAPRLAGLTRLVLWNNQIGDAGVEALAASPHLAGLSHLDLGHNRVGDRGARALAESPHLGRLTSLILVSNLIGDEGALALARSATLAGLAELKPLDNRIGPLGAGALRDRFGRRVRIY